MNTSFVRVYEDPLSRNWSLQTKIGHAIDILARSKLGSLRSIRYAENTLIPAIRHEQIEFIFDEDRTPVSYVIWACLTADVEDRIITKSIQTLHLSEWNEGESIWIIDLVAPLGHLKYVMKHLRDRLFSQVGRVRFARVKKNTIRVLEIERSLLSGCLRSMKPDPSVCRCGHTACQCWNGLNNAVPVNFARNLI